MNKSDMKCLTDNLESLDALGKLFSNFWYPRIKAEINDEKLRAYLTVYEDAIPGMGNVLQYVKENAEALATGDSDTIMENFSILSDVLLSGGSFQKTQSKQNLDNDSQVSSIHAEVKNSSDSIASDELLSTEQGQVLESIEQDNIEDLLATSEEMVKNETDEIELDDLLVDDVDNEVDLDIEDITADISEEEMSSILEDHASQEGEEISETLNNEKGKSSEKSAKDEDIDALFE